MWKRNNLSVPIGRRLHSFDVVRNSSDRYNHHFYQFSWSKPVDKHWMSDCIQKIFFNFSLFLFIFSYFIFYFFRSSLFVFCTTSQINKRKIFTKTFPKSNCIHNSLFHLHYVFILVYHFSHFMFFYFYVLFEERFVH